MPIFARRSRTSTIVTRTAKLKGDCSTYDPGSWAQCDYVTKLAKAMQASGHGTASSTTNLATCLSKTWNSPGQMLVQVPGLYVEANASLDLLLSALPALHKQIWDWIATHAPSNIPKESGMTEGHRSVCPRCGKPVR